jgi:malate dehydrogenase (oxaloacetate-decarboxylating)(NADP+)
MKIAAARALAALAREDVPDGVLKAYGLARLSFGRDYLIPKPFDPRVLLSVAPAVAEAAMRTGVARRPLADLGAYRQSLERILGPSRELMRLVVQKARQRPVPHRIVFPEGHNPVVLRAARAIADERIATPVLVGTMDRILPELRQLGLDRHAFEIVDPDASPSAELYAAELYQLRQRKGLTPAHARELTQDPTIFALMMVRMGEAAGFVGGIEKSYPETIRPALQIVGLRDGVSRLSALHLLMLKDRLFFCADTMINIVPTAEEVAEIAILAADTARFFDIEPRVALLAFSSFGSVRHPIAERMARAVTMVRARRPDLIVDGEMHLESAITEEIVREHYPHSVIRGDANVLIFPDLTSGNIGYQIAKRLGRAEVIGPILMGLRRPVTVVPHATSAADIVNLAAITAAAVTNGLEGLDRGQEAAERTAARPASPEALPRNASTPAATGPASATQALIATPR